jgi:hypothetical protein
MSDQLQLTGKLIEDIQNVLISHDQKAQDQGVTLQYLAAVSGLILGNLNMPSAQKQDFLEQLHAFSKHVLDDLDQQKQSQPPTQEAFGIWRPGDK